MEREELENLYNLLNKFYLEIEHTEKMNKNIDLVLDEIYCDFLAPSLDWCINK